MRIVNQTTIVAKPKQPFIDWFNTHGDDLKMVAMEGISFTSYLIPDDFDELNYLEFVKKNFKIIFQEELNSWSLDRNTWPRPLSYKVFSEWFKIEVADTTVDLGDGVIEVEKMDVY